MRFNLLPSSRPRFAIVGLGHAASRRRYNSSTVSGLGARNIGSAAMSGRVSAMAANKEPSGKITLFVGAASGGVWKSEDGGTQFKPIFDEQPVQSIGAIALDPKNSKNVWVGTGEPWTRNSVSIGNGMYRSTDGGETWTRAGLPNSERIAEIIVSPENGETAYAAVPGALWSDSPDRGLYKTTDGGRTWNLILKGANLSTGCSTIAMDPTNPNVLFAGMWDFRRKGWTFRSGGEGPDAPSGSGLFRSTDGGAHLDRSHAGKQQRLSEKALWPARVSDRAFERETRLLPSSKESIARFSSPTTAARPGTSATRAPGWFGGRSISRS